MNAQQIDWCVREITSTMDTVERVGEIIEVDGTSLTRTEAIQFLANMRDEFLAMKVRQSVRIP